MSPKEHHARAMLMGLAYDHYTTSYRPMSPEGRNYKYSGCLDADTLEPLGMGVALKRENVAGVGNTVSNVRRGLTGGSE